MVSENSNKSVIAAKNAAEIKTREEKRKIRVAEKNKGVEEEAAESKKAEEAAARARKTKHAAVSKARGDFSEEESRRAQISRDRRAREIAREQEARRDYQEPVGFFGIQKDLMQSPPRHLTSTRRMSAQEGRFGLPEVLQWRHEAGSMQPRQQVSPEGKAQLRRDVIRIRKDMEAHSTEMSSKAAASVSCKIAQELGMRVSSL